MFFATSSVCFLFCLVQVFSHPQCKDTDPPFKISGAEPVFCQRYKEFGCCTREENTQMEQRYNQALQSAQNAGLTGCEKFLKDILCQFCSPYAAHVFEIEPNFPDLCPTYCSNFYDKCQGLVRFITDDTVITDALASKELFCNTVNLENTPYCWPDIIDNTDLNNELERQTSSTAGCLCLKEFAKGLENPLRFKYPKDGTGRVFVMEQRGLIWVYTKEGRKLSKPFIDMSGRIKLFSSLGEENGMIGFEFHRDFKNNGKFFLYYTRHGKPGFNSESVISEYKVSVSNPNEADIHTEFDILIVDQPTSIHNGGELIHALDGYLYIFLGDGGPANDGLNHSQNRSTMLGSILRIDISNPDHPYTIPDDNPFVGVPGVRPEIYAYGVRNPWRADEDEGDPETGYGRGRIFFGDVGQARWEEVDRLDKGANYGWRPKEGKQCTKHRSIKPSECSLLKGDTDPLIDYGHEVGNAVVPGIVYRGCHSPALNGLYIFGFHYHSTLGGRLFYLKEKSLNSNQWDSVEINLCGTDVCYNGWVNSYGKYIMGFGEDEDGEIYLMSSNTAQLGDNSGQIHRLVDPSRRGDPDSCRSKKRENTPTTESPSTSTTESPSTTTTQPPSGCVLDTSWRYPKRLKVSVPGRRKKIKCNRCSCEKMESKHLKLLEAACNGNTQARVKCCPLCKKHGFI